MPKKPPPDPEVLRLYGYSKLADPTLWRCRFCGIRSYELMILPQASPFIYSHISCYLASDMPLILLDFTYLDQLPDDLVDHYGRRFERDYICAHAGKHWPT